jgi:hypothetical protein
MIRNIIYTLLFCLFVGSGVAQQKFPSIKGTTLDEKHLQIPINNGKTTIVAIAFHRDAEGLLKAWLNPLYDSFIKKEEGGNFDLAEYFDVNFVFIPLIQGFRKVADEFKQNTDPAFWPYILDTEKTDVKELQKQLGVTDNKHPYFYVVDSENKVTAFVSGSFSNQKLKILEDAAE